MATHTDQFIKNVNRWVIFCPKSASELLEEREQTIILCRTKQGELNLKRIVDGKECFFHSTENAQEEADQWFRSLDLYQVKTLIVYGVGLGYFFESAKEWLLEDPKHHLVFLENDLEVIQCLFDTDLGNELMLNKQVRIFSLEMNENGELKDTSFEAIPSTYFLENHIFSTLKYYLENNFVLSRSCEKFLGYFKNFRTYQVMEQVSFGKGFFANFYRNLLELSLSKFADNMYGKFAGMPAIICGAGPSLSKNLPLLETLKDKACIIAGGSAMNAVNVNGFNPHFGIALDPNLSQYSRLFMNQAYEVPYFYRNRLFPEALTLLHGEHLYVSGSGGYGVAKWFEQKLGIEGEEVQEGNNVVNFGIAIAHALGCNPIILVGADMAYSNNDSYAPGVLPHPIIDVGQVPKTRRFEDELVQKRDINGNIVSTLWKWITESVWITQFALSHSEVKIINATEGGIGMESIPNMSLEEVVEEYFKNPLDLESLIHLEIQKSVFDRRVTKKNTLALMDEMKKSLLTTKRICKELSKEFSKVLESLKKAKEQAPKLITDKSLELLKELNQEAAFTAVLSKFNESFLSIYGRHDLEDLYEHQDKRIDQTEINRRRTKLNFKRYKFLKAASKENHTQIDRTILEDRIRSIILSELRDKHGEEGAGKNTAGMALKRFKNETYVVEDTCFEVEDAELQISLKGPLLKNPVVQINNGQEIQDLESDFSGVLQFLDHEGKMKLESHYINGKLNGPSSGIFIDGTLSSRCFYDKGMKQGKVVFYYPSGALYALLSYKDGVLVGLQEYFFEDGGIKTSFNYLAGKLHGEVRFYFSNGVVKRTLTFDHGKRQGKELIWNLGGIKEVEANYEQDKPVGYVRSWHLNGHLSRKILYDQDSLIASVQGWTADGVELPIGLLMREDYFGKISKKTKRLTGFIEEVYGHFRQIAPKMEKEGGMGLENEMDELKVELEKLREMHNIIEKQAQNTSENAKEVLWKTPETQRILGKQLEDVTEKMVEDIGTIEYSLKILDALLKRTSEEDKE